MKRALAILSVLAACFFGLNGFAHASLSGPTQSQPYGTVTYGSNSVDTVFAPQYGSVGGFTWTAADAMTVTVSFDYLITANNNLNNIGVGDLNLGSTYSLYYTDGLTQHFTGIVSLAPFGASPDELYVTADAGNSGKVNISNISVSSVPVPCAVLLFASGLVGLGALRKRFPSSSSQKPSGRT